MLSVVFIVNAFSDWSIKEDERGAIITCDNVFEMRNVSVPMMFTKDTVLPAVFIVVNKEEDSFNVNVMFDDVDIHTMLFNNFLINDKKSIFLIDNNTIRFNEEASKWILDIMLNVVYAKFLTDDENHELKMIMFDVSNLDSCLSEEVKKIVFKEEE